MSENRELKDKIIECVGCTKQFVFSVSEQEFFLQRKLEHEPKRCFHCRKLRREKSEKKGAQPRLPNELHAIKCSDCGNDDTVPFIPIKDKPVYCRPCLYKRRSKVAQI